MVLQHLIAIALLQNTAWPGESKAAVDLAYRREARKTGKDSLTWEGAGLTFSHWIEQSSLVGCIGSTVMETVLPGRDAFISHP